MMTTIDSSITPKQFSTLALIGLLILVLFAASFVWLAYGGAEVFPAFAEYWIYPYLAVSSFYVGFLAVRFTKGRRKRAWLWGIAGFTLTLLFIIGLPSLLSSIFPYSDPAIFAGHAIFAFLAPVVSALFIVRLTSISRKATV